MTSHLSLSPTTHHDVPLLTLSAKQRLYFTPHIMKSASMNSTEVAASIMPAVDTPTLLRSTLQALLQLSTQATSTFQSLDSDMQEISHRMEKLSEFVEKEQKRDPNGDAPRMVGSPHVAEPQFIAPKRAEISLDLNPNSQWSAAYAAADPAVPNLSALPMELRQERRYSDAQAPISHWIQEETLKKRREYARWRKRKRERENAHQGSAKQPIMVRTVKKMELYHEKLREHRFKRESVQLDTNTLDDVAAQSNQQGHETHIPSPLSVKSHQLSARTLITESAEDDEMYVNDEQMHTDEQSVTSISVSSPPEEVQIGTVPNHIHQPPVSPPSHQNKGHEETPMSPSAPPPPSPLLKPDIKKNAPPFASKGVPPPPLPTTTTATSARPPAPGGAPPPPPPPLNLDKLNATRASSGGPTTPRPIHSRSPGALTSPDAGHHRKQSSNLSSSLFDQIKAGNFNLKKAKTRSFDEAPQSPASPQDNIMSQIRDFRKNNQLRSVSTRIATDINPGMVSASSAASPTSFTTVADILRFSTMNMDEDEDISDETDDFSDGDDLESW
uniref:WH2 domain-containing protein n=1 Tax=Percolomonas cosmopolitus TaxID=63605 RepID=A0A7S1KQP8_9EUKA